MKQTLDVAGGSCREHREARGESKSDIVKLWVCRAEKKGGGGGERALQLKGNKQTHKKTKILRKKHEKNAFIAFIVNKFQ